ncbi:MAG: amino acid ABC transporter permease [Christensenellales bacterium]
MSTGRILLSLLDGFGVSLQIFAMTLLFAIPLGLIVAFGSMSRIAPIKYLAKTFVWIIRGTPLMLQIIVIFYGPGLLGWKVSIDDRLTAVIVAFVINYSCYFSEIYRGGIEAISKGQYEAGYVLGMTKSQVFFKVTLPQVFRRITAPMSNEVITLVKDTSLARIIAVAEIIKKAEDVVNVHGIIWPLLCTGLFYLLFNGLLTILFNYIERRLSYYKI